MLDPFAVLFFVYKKINHDGVVLSPVIRTNPVTGWKSLFGAGHQVAAGWINGVTERESEILKQYCKPFISLSDRVRKRSSS